MEEKEQQAEGLNCYKVVNKADGLMQGDLLFDFPILKSPYHKIYDESNEEPSDTVKDIYDVVVLSQSCDLEYCKVELVIVCPFILWSNYKIEKDKKKKNSWMGDAKPLVDGRIGNKCLLPKCEKDGFENDYFLVDYKEIHTIPFDFIYEHISRIGERLRLISPYREYLSQSFSRFFMRVALHEDVFKDFEQGRYR